MYGKDTASSGPGAPLAGFKRLRDSRPGPGAQVYVGLCWLMLAYLAGNVGPAWSYVGPAWGYVGRILKAMWADLGAMLVHLGAMLARGPSWGYGAPSWSSLGLSGGSCERLGAIWAHLGAIYVGLSWPILGLYWPILRAIWAHLRAMLAHLGAMFAHLGPILGLCWPILSLWWPILRPMLAHVDPSWATCSEKLEKMGRAQNTVKCGTFWQYAVGGVFGGRVGGPSRRGENAVREGHGQHWALAGFKRLRATAGQGPMLRW